MPRAGRTGGTGKPASPVRVTTVATKTKAKAAGPKKAARKAGASASAAPKKAAPKRAARKSAAPAGESAADPRTVIERKNYIIASMKEIGHALSTTLSQENLLQLIISKTTDLMEADRSSLFLVDKEAGQIWSLIAQGDNMQEIRLPLGMGIAGTVAKTGKTINIPDAYKDKRFNPAVDKQTGYRTRSILCMPMRSHDGSILGVIQVLNKLSGPFTADDETLLDALSSQAALSLQNSELYTELQTQHLDLVMAQERLQAKIGEIDTLYEIEREVGRSENVEKLLDSIMQKTMKFMQAEAGSVLLKEAGTNQLFFKVAMGEKGDDVKKERLKVGEGIVGWVAEKGEPLLVSDAYLDERFRKDIAEKVGFPTKSIICVPLIVEDEILGAMELINKVDEQGKPLDQSFTQDDAKLLQLIGSQVAKAIHVTQLRNEQERNERLATIGQMISGLMHDMQTPMTSIVGFVELMGLPDCDATERQEFSEIVKKEVDRLTQMIRAHLDFAKGKTDILLKKMGVGKFIEDMVNFLEKDFKENRIAIRTDLDYRGMIRVDESKIRRAFYNLAKNAKEAMPGGGTLSIVTGENNGNVVFKFSDTGTGIPEEIRPKLFESFVTFGKENGTGLGLAQVKSAVDQHGGTIDVESAQGKGTTFTIALPIGD